MRHSQLGRGADRGPVHGAARRSAGGDRGSAGGDRGSASIEFLGFLPVLLLVALAGVQLGLVAYVGSQAGTAARAAARTETRQATRGMGHDAGVASVSGWLQGDIDAVDLSNDGTGVTATVTISIPSVLPGVHLFGPVTRRATMPSE